MHLQIQYIHYQCTPQNKSIPVFHTHQMSEIWYIYTIIPLLRKKKSILILWYQSQNSCSAQTNLNTIQFLALLVLFTLCSPHLFQKSRLKFIRKIAFISQQSKNVDSVPTAKSLSVPVCLFSHNMLILDHK